MLFIIRILFYVFATAFMCVIDATLLLIIASQISQFVFLSTVTWGTWFWLNAMVTLPITTGIGISKAMEELA